MYSIGRALWASVFLPVKEAANPFCSRAEGCRRRNRWWCLHKVAINMWACFSLSLDYFERFFFSLPALETSPAKQAAIRVTPVPSHLPRGQSFPAAGPWPPPEIPSPFCKRTSYGLPPMLHSVNGPLVILQMRKSNKASIPSGKGQGLPGRRLLLLESLTGLSLSRTVYPLSSRATVILWHLLVAKSCQFYLLNVFPVCPFECNTELSTSLSCSHTWNAEAASHQSPVSPPPPTHPLFCPVWSCLAAPSPCCKPSGVTVPHRV